MGMDQSPGKPIEEWTDTELLDQFRFLIRELSDETSYKKAGDDGPLKVLVDEIGRRGLSVPAERS